MPFGWLIDPFGPFGLQYLSHHWVDSTASPMSRTQTGLELNRALQEVKSKARLRDNEHCGEMQNEKLVCYDPLKYSQEQ